MKSKIAEMDAFTVFVVNKYTLPHARTYAYWHAQNSIPSPGMHGWNFFETDKDADDVKSHPPVI